MRKALLLVNNFIEDVEALATRALLARANYDVTTFTLEDKLTVITAFGLSFDADKLIGEINENEYDFLVLPGGKHVSLWHKKSVELKELINDFNQSKKLIAAICAAPLFLDELNLLENKNFTAFPDVINKIKGNAILTDKAVTSDNIITARSAGVVYDFVFEIIKYYEGENKIEVLKTSIVY